MATIRDDTWNVLNMQYITPRFLPWFQVDRVAFVIEVEMCTKTSYLMNLNFILVSLSKTKREWQIAKNN